MAIDVLAGKRILIVEDNFLVAQDLRAIMDRAGCKVIGPILNAPEALDVLERQAIDGALLDVNLRLSTSAPVAIRLRVLGIPFLVVTGYARKDLAPELRAAPYLGKPVAADELRALAGAMFR